MIQNCRKYGNAILSSHCLSLNITSTFYFQQMSTFERIGADCIVLITLHETCTNEKHSTSFSKQSYLNWFDLSICVRPFIDSWGRVTVPCLAHPPSVCVRQLSHFLWPVGAFLPIPASSAPAAADLQAPVPMLRPTDFVKHIWMHRVQGKRQGAAFYLHFFCYNQVTHGIVSSQTPSVSFLLLDRQAFLLPAQLVQQLLCQFRSK